jgi:glucose/arabinose dehydrogenase
MLNDSLQVTSEVILFEQLPTGAGFHVGGGLRASADGKLWATDGENGFGSTSQDLQRLEGKLIRLNLDGSIPQDNPFVGNANARDEIYQYGLRNPFRFAIQPATGVPYICDVGKLSFEEINAAPPGANFGWSLYEGTTTPPAPGFTNPVYDYPRESGAAIVGCAFYTGFAFPPEYWGNFFFLDHARGQVGRVTFDASHSIASVEFPWASTATSGWGPGPVDLVLANDGSLYYSTNTPGTVRRIFYLNNTDAPTPKTASRLEFAIPSPNPFRGALRLVFTLPEAAKVRLSVLDVQGRLQRLLAEASMPPGRHAVIWEGRDADGHMVPAGIYFVHLTAGDRHVVQRTVRVR